MSGMYGMNIKMAIYGESHGASIGLLIDGIPPGLKLDLEAIEKEMHMGNLILVNYAYPYAFAESEVSEIVTVSSAKNDNYVVRDNKIELRKSTIDIFNTMMDDMFAATNFNKLQVNSAYRSYEDQVATYEYKSTNLKKYLSLHSLHIVKYPSLD